MSERRGCGPKSRTRATRRAHNIAWFDAGVLWRAQALIELGGKWLFGNVDDMDEEKEDPVWSAAWRWVVREYDRTDFDVHARAEMAAWLQADPRHRVAYERAARVWLLAGLVPPTNDLGDWDEQEPPPPQP